MNREANLLHVNIMTEVYIDPEINNRELADTEDETASLANSIESTAGLLQPIVVYATPDARRKEHGMPYELGSGYRRCAALKHLAVSLQDDSWVESVPAMIHEKTDIGERHIHQLVENLQRKDLKPMEIALAFHKAINDKAASLSQSELNCSKSTCEKAPPVIALDHSFRTLACSSGPTRIAVVSITPRRAARTMAALSTSWSRVIGKNRPHGTALSACPERPMRWSAAPIERGDPIRHTRSTVPMSMPSSSDAVATAHFTCPNFSFCSAAKRNARDIEP